MTARIRIPADVDREDRILAGLTARQLTIGATAALTGWVLWTTASQRLPAGLAAALVTPLLLAGLVLVVGRRDGQPLDRLLVAGLCWWRRPRQLVPAPDGVAPPPAWAAPAAGDRRPPAALHGPLCGLDPGGLVDLGGEGVALLCRASPVNFRLYTPAEQQQLVAAFARLLQGLDAPVQLLVRADHLDLHELVAALETSAASLPHPALEAAARAHARFLDDLAGRRDLLRRELLLVFRDPTGGPDAHGRLLRRVEQATDLLAAAGIAVAPLDGDGAAAALARAADPHRPPRPAGLAPAGVVITGPSR
jgi:hypothetical protein